MTRQLRWNRVALMTVLGFAACGGPNEPNLRAADIVVSPNGVTIAQLQTQRLEVSVVDDDGALLSGVAVTFESANEAIATVSNLGLVTSIGPAGTTSVTVRAAGIQRQVPVAVTAIADRISVSPNPAAIPQNGTLQLSVQLLDLAGAPVTGAVFDFESSNSGVATVSPTGLVTSVGPAGQTTIAISSGGVTAQSAVAVTQVPTSLVVVPDPTRLGRGGSAQVQATVLDATGVAIVGSPFTYQASPANRFTISTSGVLTASQTLGTGTVTVRSGELEKVVDASVISATHPAGAIAATTSVSISSPFGPAIAPNGRVAVGGLNGGLARGLLPNFSLSTSQIGGLITAVAFSASGRLFASGAPSDGVSEIDPATGTVLGSLNGLSGTPYDLLVSSDEQTLFLSTSNGVIYFIDLPTLTVRHQVQVSGSLVHLALHPTLPLLYASPQGATQIFEINTGTRASRGISIPVSAPQAIAVSIDGTELYVASEAGTVEVVPLTAGVSAASIPLGCGAYGLVQTPDGAQLYVSCALAGTVKILDRAARSVVGTLATGGTPRRIAVSFDGATVVVANEGGWVNFIQ
jgi:YVTN family beta-propeller protein